MTEAGAATQFDTANLHSNTLDPTNACPAPESARMVAPRAGIYRVEAGVLWPSSPTGKRYLGLRLAGGTYVAAVEQDANTASATLQSVSTLVSLAQGAHVEVAGLHTNGIPLLLGSDPRSYMSMSLVGAR